jgi:DNA-binding protein HU-beta
MNKLELINEIAESTGLSSKQSGTAVNAFIDTVTQALKNKDSLTLVGFGTFSLASRAARIGRNPKTGEEIKIKASMTPKFKAGKTLKDIISGAAKPKAKASKPANSKVAKSTNVKAVKPAKTEKAKTTKKK